MYCDIVEAILIFYLIGLKVRIHNDVLVKRSLPAITFRDWYKGSSIVRTGELEGSSLNACHDGAHFYLGLGFKPKEEACVNAWEAGLTAQPEEALNEMRYGITKLQHLLKNICRLWLNDDYSWLTELEMYFERGREEQICLAEIREKYLEAKS